MTTSPPPWETLADARQSVLRLAQRAREDKNAALEKELEAQAKALKMEITRLRRAGHAAWQTATVPLRAQLTSAQARLTRIVESIAADQKRIQSASQALSVVQKILAAAKAIVG